MKSSLKLLFVAIIVTLLVILPATVHAYSFKINKQTITVTPTTTGYNVSPNNIITTYPKPDLIYIDKGDESIIIESQNKPYTQELGPFLKELNSVRTEFQLKNGNKTYYQYYGYKHKKHLYYRVKFSTETAAKPDLYNQVMDTLEVD